MDALVKHLGITLSDDYRSKITAEGPFRIYSRPDVMNLAVFSLYDIDSTASDMLDTYSLSLAQAIDLGVFPVASAPGYGDIFLECSRNGSSGRAVEIESWTSSGFVENKTWPSFSEMTRFFLDAAQDGNPEKVVVEYPNQIECNRFIARRGKILSIF